MPANSGAQVIRRIEAADNETIEIRWSRVRVSVDNPRERIREILIERHSVPPGSVWEARHKDPNDE